MDPHLIEIFKEQVLLQCRFALIAGEQVNEGLNRTDVIFTFYQVTSLEGRIGLFGTLRSGSNTVTRPRWVAGVNGFLKKMVCFKPITLLSKLSS
jgi:hypothetical protein